MTEVPYREVLHRVVRVCRTAPQVIGMHPISRVVIEMNHSPDLAYSKRSCDAVQALEGDHVAAQSAWTLRSTNTHIKSRKSDFWGSGAKNTCGSEGKVMGGWHKSLNLLQFQTRMLWLVFCQSMPVLCGPTACQRCA